MACSDINSFQILKLILSVNISGFPGCNSCIIHFAWKPFLVVIICMSYLSEVLRCRGAEVNTCPSFPQLGFVAGAGQATLTHVPSAVTAVSWAHTVNTETVPWVVSKGQEKSKGQTLGSSGNCEDSCLVIFFKSLKTQFKCVCVQASECHNELCVCWSEPQPVLLALFRSLDRTQAPRWPVLTHLTISLVSSNILSPIVEFQWSIYFQWLFLVYLIH